MPTDELTRWYQQLRTILDAAADGMRTLGIARSGAGLSASVQVVADASTDEILTRIDALVVEANASAERIRQADPRLASVVHPLLSVPGAPPEVDLRPWWNRLLQRISSTAQRGALGETLETLRLEADAALIRATGALAKR